MKERPILFSAPMVRAILEGRKTVTRRVVRERLGAYSDGSFVVIDADGDPIDVELRRYALAGDRLWVRETWQARDSRGAVAGRTPTLGCHTLSYRATSDDSGPWRPSIFMPRWASRILLEVVSVRVERLQEITEEDARREGVDGPGRGHRLYPGTDAARGSLGYRAVFAELWDTINGKRAAWASNPWVWRVEFRVVP